MALATIGYFILTLAILVTVHEYGHYWVGRRCGVKALTFSVGFGPSLWRRTDKNGTEWVVAALPLGGYVRFLDEREGAVPSDEQPFCFNRQSALARAAIIAAGPITNFILAILVYTAISMLGVSGRLPVVGDVEPDSAAFHAGFERGQTIVAVDGEPTPTQYRLHMQLINRIGETGSINFDLRYPESTALYQASLPIDNWLTGDDRPEIYQSLGFGYFYPDMPALIERVIDGGPADLAGILAGDEITAINGVAVKDWRAAVEQIKVRPLQSVEVELLRTGSRVTAVVETQAITLDDGVQHGRIGVQAAAVELPASMMVIQRYGPLEALYQGFARTGELIAFTFSSIKKMLMGLISTSSLSGPVSIAKMASATASSGFIPYMEFLALLSVSLGVLNLLPIPVLDGGHLMYIAIEAITRRPVSERLQIWGQQLGLVLILSIMALALYNDISHF